MNRIGIFVAMLLCCLAASAISLDEIRNSGLYYYGEGVDEEAARADLKACEMLASQISANVTSHTTLIDTSQSVRQNGKERKDEHSEYLSVIDSYSQATIENSEVLTLPADKGKTHIFRYISKQNVYKVFAERRNRIKSLLDNSNKQLELGKLDIALKDLYWAYALLRSMPSTSTETWRDHNLFSYIPTRIEEILDDIKIEITAHEGADFELFFKYKGQPVNSLDYFYVEDGYDGPLCNVGEGYGEVSLANPADAVDLVVEFRYADQASDSEMQAVLKGVSQFKTKRARHHLDTKRGRTTMVAETSTASTAKSTAQAEPAAPAKSTAQAETAAVKPAEPQMQSELKDPGVYRQNILTILNAIEKKQKTSEIRKLMTDKGALKYSAIIKRGSAKVKDSSNLQFWTGSMGCTVCRGAVMTFSYRTGKYRNFVRDVVFTFDNDGLLSDIALGVGEKQRNDILANNNIPEGIRHAFVEFVENYQTAFAMADTAYLRAIFDDNAIIITGTVAPKVAGRAEDYAYRNDQRIIYNRFSKDEYLKKLERTFNAKEYVNLKFDNIEADLIDDDSKTYGMRLEQDYFSPGYNDHGYLYLQFQMLDPEHPIIHVRTWQPTSVPIRDIFNYSDFPIRN